jgi:hypothetical protein
MHHRFLTISMEVSDWLFYSSMVFSLIAWIANQQNLYTPPLRSFVWLILFNLVVEAIGLTMRNHGVANAWLYNLYILIEFTFFNWLYYEAIFEKKLKRIIRVVSLLFPVLFLVNEFWIQGFHIFNTYGYIVGALIVLVWVAMYFIQLLNRPLQPTALVQPLFWISTGLLFFYLGNIPFYGMINYLMEVYPDTLQRYFIIVHLLIMVKFILFGVGFICSRTNPN